MRRARQALMASLTVSDSPANAMYVIDAKTNDLEKLAEKEPENYTKVWEHFGGVLKADGVADDDIATIASAVTGLKSQIVSAAPVEKTACDAGVGQ